MGPSGFPVPPPTYLDAVDKLFRQPHPVVARQTCAGLQHRLNLAKRQAVDLLRHRWSRGAKHELNSCIAGATICPDGSAQSPGRSHMSDTKLRWLGLGLVTTASAGVLGLTAMMNRAFAHADDSDIPNMGWVLGASG